MIVKTVVIHTENGPVVINESDFDSAKHELYEEFAYVEFSTVEVEIKQVIADLDGDSLKNDGKPKKGELTKIAKAYNVNPEDVYGL